MRINFLSRRTKCFCRVLMKKKKSRENKCSTWSSSWPSPSAKLTQSKTTRRDSTKWTEFKEWRIKTRCKIWKKRKKSYSLRNQTWSKSWEDSWRQSNRWRLRRRDWWSTQKVSKRNYNKREKGTKSQKFSFSNFLNSWRSKMGKRKTGNRNTQRCNMKRTCCSKTLNLQPET